MSVDEGADTTLESSGSKDPRPTSVGGTNGTSENPSSGTSGGTAAAPSASTASAENDSFPSDEEQSSGTGAVPSSSGSGSGAEETSNIVGQVVVKNSEVNLNGADGGGSAETSATTSTAGCGGAQFSDAQQGAGQGEQESRGVTSVEGTDAASPARKSPTEAGSPPGAEKKMSCQGCGKMTGQSNCCPVCAGFNRNSFFCGQECFARNWPTHQNLHILLKQQQELSASLVRGGAAAPLGPKGAPRVDASSPTNSVARGAVKRGGGISSLRDRMFNPNEVEEDLEMGPLGPAVSSVSARASSIWNSISGAMAGEASSGIATPDGEDLSKQVLLGS